MPQVFCEDEIVLGRSDGHRTLDALHLLLRDESRMCQVADVDQPAAFQKSANVFGTEAIPYRPKSSYIMFAVEILDATSHYRVYLIGLQTITSLEPSG